MRDGKNQFYRQLKIDKITRRAITLYNKIKNKMVAELEGKKKL